MKKNLICYCFNYSEEDISRDIREHNGTSTILQQITEAKQQGACNCARNHPLGR